MDPCPILVINGVINPCKWLYKWVTGVMLAGKSPFFIGDASSKWLEFSIVMLVFRCLCTHAKQVVQKYRHSFFASPKMAMSKICFINVETIKKTHGPCLGHPPSDCVTRNYIMTPQIDDKLQLTTQQSHKQWLLIIWLHFESTQLMLIVVDCSHLIYLILCNLCIIPEVSLSCIQIQPYGSYGLSDSWVFRSVD